MHLEYLIFNIVVMAGPLAFGSMKRFYFIDRWKYAFLSIGIVAIPFIIWDALVTNRHWWFSESYTLDLRLVYLPIEEIMFFITVPFACLFTWEMIKKYISDRNVAFGNMVHILAFSLPLVGILLFLNGKEYTGLVMFSLFVAIMADKLLKTNLVNQRCFYWYLTTIIIFTLIFNGYLTARSVVLYGETYQLGLRVFTIPIEDFGYGISLLFLCTILYEKFKTMFLIEVKRVKT